MFAWRIIGGVGGHTIYIILKMYQLKIHGQLDMIKGITVLKHDDAMTVREIGIHAGLEAAIRTIHTWAKERGWWTNVETGVLEDRNKGELIALMHSELSECLEGVRKNLMDDHMPDRRMEEAELADLFIRMCDYCGGFNLDLAGAVIEKMRYNAERPDHSLENRAKKGGKKF